VRRLYLVGFPLLMAFDTVAQLAFKLAGDAALPVELDGPWLLRVLSQPWIYCAMACYAASFVTYISILRHAPIGPAFAASHLEVAAVVLCSAWLLDEPLGVPQLLGAALVVAGIICLGADASRDGDGDGDGDADGAA